MRIVISEFMDDEAVDTLRDGFEVRYEPDLVDHREELLRAVVDADALIVRNRCRVDAALLQHAGTLKAVGRLGVGLDNIDVGACEARGIAVLPATGANARAVAEYVIATVLLLLRGAYGATAEVAAGAWPRLALSSGLEANGRTLGIAGFGAIGRLVARLARGLDMRVVGYDPLLKNDDPAWRAASVTPVDLDTLLAHSDAVTLHVPLTESTRGLLDARRLATMKPEAVLVNTARGGIIDEAALAQALREGKLRGAAIDVFETEPMPAGHVLSQAPRLIMTPHVAGLTAEANTRVSAMVAERIIAALRKAA
jgi:(S)-sulfolactate dehydrogenase